MLKHPWMVMVESPTQAFIKAKQEAQKELENFATLEKPLLQKLVYLQLAHNIDDKQVVELKNQFIKIDKDKSGKISRTEIRDFFAD